jgi:hypothetical protein
MKHMFLQVIFNSRSSAFSAIFAYLLSTSIDELISKLSITDNYCKSLFSVALQTVLSNMKYECL